MVAGIAYEYRVSEDELDKALNAITPFIIRVIQHAEGRRIGFDGKQTC